MLDDSALDSVIAHHKPDLFGSIRGAVEQMIKTTVPDGKNVAVIAHGDLKGNLTFGFAARVADHWEFSATLEKALGLDTPMTGSWSVIFTA